MGLLEQSISELRRFMKLLEQGKITPVEYQAKMAYFKQQEKELRKLMRETLKKAKQKGGEPQMGQLIQEINELRQLLRLVRQGKITNSEFRGKMAYFKRTSRETGNLLKELSKKANQSKGGEPLT